MLFFERDEVLAAIAKIYEAPKAELCELGWPNENGDVVFAVAIDRQNTSFTPEELNERETALESGDAGVTVTLSEIGVEELFGINGDVAITKNGHFLVGSFREECSDGASVNAVSAYLDALRALTQENPAAQSVVDVIAKALGM